MPSDVGRSSRARRGRCLCRWRSGPPFGGAALEDTVPAWFLLAAAYGVGFALRGQRIESTLLARRTERLEQEREQRARLAVAEERVRIARELHDIIAHTISVMVVQAQAGQRVLEGEQASAREALGVDRDDRPAGARRDAPAARDPPERGREPALAPAAEPGRTSTCSSSGCARPACRSTCRSRGSREPLPPGVDLSAYRIVQEALTNALQHAGPASAGSSSATDATAVELEITDNGEARDGRAGTCDGTSGHGLVGMRERVALVGGTVEAGAGGGRGYTVRARLPST